MDSCQKVYFKWIQILDKVATVNISNEMNFKYFATSSTINVFRTGSFLYSVV